MPSTHNSPYLAFPFFLLITLTLCLIVQTVGHIVDVPLAQPSIFISLPVALVFTYAYCFPLSTSHVRIALLQGMILAVIGIASRHWLDFTADGLGYQQPSAEVIMNGWNPFRSDSVMLWQNIYPSGATATEAALAFLYGSIEDAKMVQIWWLFIALPVLLLGLQCHKPSVTRVEKLLVVICVLSFTVLNQLLTHYVDSLTYLAGLTFIGGLLLYGHSRHGNIISGLIMACAVIFVINTKLSGIYHAFALCAAAVIFCWLMARRFPWKLAFILLSAGIVSVLVIGYRPYVTSFMHYGLTLFPEKTESFSGAQRPSSFDGLSGFARFFYSLFSITGGAPHQPAQLKWPWILYRTEWKFSGDPDARTGGLGPLFALGFLLSLAVFAYALLRKLPVDKGLLWLAVICLLSSAVFPQSWWMRYVPFAYCAPFLLLFSVQGDRPIRIGLYGIALIFMANGAMAFGSAYSLFHESQIRFDEVTSLLRRQPTGSVYLVPPVANYAKYNGAYMPLTRRLKEQGVDSTIKIGAPCPHMAEMYAEFAVCY